MRFEEKLKARFPRFLSVLIRVHPWLITALFRLKAGHRTVLTRPDKYTWRCRFPPRPLLPIAAVSVSTFSRSTRPHFHWWDFRGRGFHSDNGGPVFPRAV